MCFTENKLQVNQSIRDFKSSAFFEGIFLNNLKYVDKAPLPLFAIVKTSLLHSLTTNFMFQFKIVYVKFYSYSNPCISYFIHKDHRYIFLIRPGRKIDEKLA